MQNLRSDSTTRPCSPSMETLGRSERLAFEDHYLTCPRCASIVASTDEYVRSIRSALERLRAEEKDSEVTRRTGTP
jgi:anti-sigma factor RsiW